MTKYEMIDKLTKRIILFLAFGIYIFKDQITKIFSKEEEINKEDDLK